MHIVDIPITFRSKEIESELAFSGREKKSKLPKAQVWLVLVGVLVVTPIVLGATIGESTAGLVYWWVVMAVLAWSYLRIERRLRS